MNISLLKNPLQEYAWGSRTFIPELLGRAAVQEKPLAEMWMGAHPKAPSSVFVEDRWTSLLDLIRRNPEEILGQDFAERFSNTLPVLFKVIAADRPLSLQAHPSLSQAREGYLRENKKGVPPGDSHRNYIDLNHKPEIFTPLCPSWVLAGFRPVSEILELFHTVPMTTLESELGTLRCHPDQDGLRTFFHALMTLEEKKRIRVIAEVLHHTGTALSDHPINRWLTELNREYPGDVGALSPLLLNLIELQPGQAVYTPPGELHAYLRGAGIELMANSDNVLRGGLTTKHMDVPELMSVLTFQGGQKEVIEPYPVTEAESVYPTPAAEFSLHVLRLRRGTMERCAIQGVEILLCTTGEVRLSSEKNRMILEKGDSVIVPARVHGYTVEGSGTVYKATVPGG
jgi:mannose-6-phosphate isomerase